LGQKCIEVHVEHVSHGAPSSHGEKPRVAEGLPTRFTGKVVLVTDDEVEEIATGLFFPTAMTFGPDGALYVSNVGFGPPTGEIVRITVPPAKDEHEGHGRSSQIDD
jgi:hypothetical protein